MTNFQLITNQAIAAGIYTEEQSIEIIATNGELPLHTFAEWKTRGYSVKKGEHAKLTAFIWKHKTKVQETEDGDEEETGRFYKVKAYFFGAEQVEKKTA